MQRQNVSSSDIKSIGYDRESHILEIEFHSGGIYQYFNVPVVVYENLMSASSHGEFFHQNIKDVYQFSKIN
jgi:hypothetical protein